MERPGRRGEPASTRFVLPSAPCVPNLGDGIRWPHITSPIGDTWGNPRLGLAGRNDCGFTTHDRYIQRPIIRIREATAQQPKVSSPIGEITKSGVELSPPIHAKNMTFGQLSAVN